MRALLVGLSLSSLITLAAAPRDPFAKPSDLEPPSPIPACTTSLCKHELRDLKLVAIATDGLASKAMFENAEGKAFIAQRHSRIGGGARITRIDRGCVTVTRFVTVANGRQQPVDERVCVAEDVLIADHDYLTDGPYKLP